MNRLASADLIPGPTNTVARQKERARTTGMVLSSTLNAIIWVLAIAMVLGEFGFNLGPIIASAGVIGVALGLGAQTLVRDILSGIFMLIEDQYGVGDKVDVLDVKGTVEKVGLRITTVRDENGTLWYLAKWRNSKGWKSFSIWLINHGISCHFKVLPQLTSLDLH